MHHALEHKGKAPQRHRPPDAPPAGGGPPPAPVAAGATREELRRRLEAALQAEDYETAAQLRDQLKELGA
jgi:hypothetical protein